MHVSGIRRAGARAASPRFPPSLARAGLPVADSSPRIKDSPRDESPKKPDRYVERKVHREEPHWSERRYCQQKDEPMGGKLAAHQGDKEPRHQDYPRKRNLPGHAQAPVAFHDPNLDLSDVP